MLNISTGLKLSLTISMVSPKTVLSQPCLASQVDIYQKLFQVLTTVFSSPWEAQELMTAILLQTSDGETSGARGE